jgi:hypothetical protein
VLVGAIFTIALLYIDFAYSSVNEMAKIARVGIWIGHGVLSGLWMVSLLQWKNPNYDYVRRVILALAIILSLIIAVHHSLSVENSQILIDSHENSVK